MCEIKASKDASMSPPVAAPAESGREVPKRVLIVDDNVDVLTTLSQWLRMGGYEVRSACNGAQAIVSTLEFEPDIVLLDIGLPDINGYDIALQLRKLANIPRFLLVAVTGYGHGSDGQEFIDAGFDRHFAKPMDLSKLESIGLHV